MIQLLPIYQQKVEKIHSLQQELSKALDTTVRLIPVEALGETFVPTESSLSHQLRNWPGEIFPLPPAAWVEPREGILDSDGTLWKYVFHGNGVSFTNLVTQAKVSAQFSVTGAYALTLWVVYMYLKYSTTQDQTNAQLIIHNETLFRELERIGHIVSIPPRLPGSDQTFVLHEFA